MLVLEETLARITSIGFTLASESKFVGNIISVRVDQVRLPNGRDARLEVITHPGGAAVVALDPDHLVCLLRQFRYAAGSEWLWELPAGKIDDQEPPLRTAQRELAEEAGREAQDWSNLGYVISSPGVFTERVHLYLAQQLTEVSTQLEPEEVLEVHWMPLTEALRMADAGEIVDGKTLVGLYRTARTLSIAT